MEYGSMATSVITNISGQAFLTVLIARCIKPFGFIASFPALSFKLSGTFTKSNTDFNPSFQSSLTSRSEEHTSELQSRENLVCRLLLEKKKTNQISILLYIYKQRTHT